MTEIAKWLSVHSFVSLVFSAQLFFETATESSNFNLNLLKYKDYRNEIQGSNSSFTSPVDI